MFRRDLEELDDTPRAKRPTRLPAVLSRSEARALIDHLPGRLWLVGSLTYGSGPRLQECLTLRVKDVDFDRRVLEVRDGKGRKDRETVLPDALGEPLRQHLDHVSSAHEKDVADGLGAVSLPEALERKYPRAPWEPGWQWVFPASREYVDTGTGLLRRHHLHPTVVHKGVRSPLDRRVLPPISQGNPIGQNSPSSQSLGRRDRDQREAAEPIAACHHPAGGYFRLSTTPDTRA